ncbi:MULTISPECIES: hypothetical protein [Streptomyces]|uniref:hypothetical protein n=1 Tax=Streptomyces TaxID=1883 RepID=UPI00142DB3BB|nr:MULTISPECIES: hypothetical protein [Streptomyces]NNJ04888.1 hypothetical protein [Streptomyces sp. PKU-MA01144]
MTTRVLAEFVRVFTGTLSWCRWISFAAIVAPASATPRTGVRLTAHTAHEP